MMTTEVLDVKALRSLRVGDVLEVDGPFSGMDPDQKMVLTSDVVRQNGVEFTVRLFGLPICKMSAIAGSKNGVPTVIWMKETI